MHLGEQMASVACNLLAALHRDPAWRSLCSVVRLAEHACPARGASWLAARRPRGGGKARLVLQPVVRPFGTAVSFEICGVTASAACRVRTVADRRHHLGGNGAGTFLLRESMIECA